MTREQTAERLGFTRCPSCQNFRQLVSYALAGFEELEIRICLTCVNQMEAAAELTEELGEISKICDITDTTFSPKFCLTQSNLAQDVQI